MLSKSVNSKIGFDVVQTEARLASHVRRVVCYGERYFEAAHICGIGRQGFGDPCLQLGATSARRGAGLAVREKGAVQYGNERLGDDGEA